MKKLISIIILISYMLCACEVSISFHHCAGDLKYLSLNDDEHEIKCCKSKKEMPDDCCKSHKVCFKKSDDKAQSFFTVVKHAPAGYKDIVLIPSIFIQAFHAVPSEQNIVFFRPPPNPVPANPLYILNSVFRI